MFKKLCNNYARWPQVQPLRAAVSSISSAPDGAYISLGLGETNRCPYGLCVASARWCEYMLTNAQGSCSLCFLHTHTAHRLMSGENVTRSRNRLVRVEHVTKIGLEQLWEIAGLRRHQHVDLLESAREEFARVAGWRRYSAGAAGGTRAAAAPLDRVDILVIDAEVCREACSLAFSLSCLPCT